MVSSDKILFTNCSVYNLPNVNSILCSNGLIEEFGFNLSSGSAKTIDLKNGVVYPGFIDAHLHLVGFGWSLDILNLTDSNSVGDVLKKLSGVKENHSKSQWIHGRGWDQNKWGTTDFPTKEMLDSVIKDRPIFLRRVDGHAAWVNSKAFEVTNITETTDDPDGGKIQRHNDGTPSGVLIDKAMDLVSKHIPPSTYGDKKRYINNAMSQLNANGITSVHDAGTDSETIHLLKEFIQQDSLTLRVYTMLNDTPEDAKHYYAIGPEFSDPWLKVQAVKFYMDGALGSKGAAMLEPYADDPNNSGLLLMDPKQIRKKIHQANSAGFQSCVHCIGDHANRILLDAYEKSGIKELRNRIEHAQIVHQDDLPRFAQLGVLPSMQPTHCTSDMGWIEDRVGENRLDSCYPWQSLIKAGSIIPGGSDAPIEYPSPLEGIYAAVTRQDKSGHPISGWQSAEAVSIHQAISMMTSWAAFASFEEDIKGKLEPGFYADFTVLDKRLESIHPQDILTTKVLHTIVNGKIVYSSNHV